MEFSSKFFHSPPQIIIARIQIWSAKRFDQEFFQHSQSEVYYVGSGISCISFSTTKFLLNVV
jgi:hypothetical protein